jgi:hypothetical protein
MNQGVIWGELCGALERDKRFFVSLQLPQNITPIGQHINPLRSQVSGLRQVRVS